MKEITTTVNVLPESVRSRLLSMPKTDNKNKSDDQAFRWNRDRHEPFQVGQFYNSPPMFFTQDGHTLNLMDRYRGCSAHLVLSGPSLLTCDYKELYKPPFLTMGVNNSMKTFRSNLWCCVDDPKSFIRSIWLDPTIQKFVPICHANKKLFHSDAWKNMNTSVGDCPNMVYYRRNEHVRIKDFLFEDTINWGNHTNYGGGRSVMLAAVRILFLLGVRRVFLVGADFNMKSGVENNYHFDQSRHKGSVNGNNSTYEKLNNWFTDLRPEFEKQNFQIFNTYKDSGLNAFDYISFEESLRMVRGEWGDIDIQTERTHGLYDTKDKNKLGVVN